VQPQTEDTNNVSWKNRTSHSATLWHSAICHVSWLCSCVCYR